MSAAFVTTALLVLLSAAPCALPAIVEPAGGGTAHPAEPPVAGENGITYPVRISSTPVAYPEAMQDKRLEARLVFRGIVRSDGSIDSLALRECEVNKPLKKPKERLRQFCPSFQGEAEKSVVQWRFDPARADGHAVDSYFMVTVEFNLQD